MASPRRTPPLAYGLLLFLGAAMALLLFLDNTITIYTGSAFRRSLSEVGLDALRDADRHSHLQATSDIDRSIEERARENDAEDRCARLLLYLPDSFADHGHGSQINTYLMAAMTAAYLDRAMVLVEPPLQGSRFAGGSQFGCPVDAFRETMISRGEAQWTIADEFPSGFSRLVRHPAWLSRGGCPVPCAATHSYSEWSKLSKAGAAREMTCANSDGTESNVVVVSGSSLRPYFRAHEARMTSDRPSPEAARWALNLGATPREGDVFSGIRDPRRSWDYALGLMIKAGFLQFQPWIARDVGLFLKSIELPVGEEYAAIHVRRGDKLAHEARAQVLQYWRSQGHTDTENLPTNYVPFAHYLSQWDGPDTCSVDDKGEVRVTPHNVYVATDDPVVVRGEIAALPNRLDEDTILWNGCHRLTFFFNPTGDSAFHLNGDGEHGFDEGRVAEGGDSCFARYRRNIASVADMMILSKARTFIGEYNSNWGRLIRTMRVRLRVPTQDGNGRVDSGNVVERRAVQKAGSLTKTLDTRVAWGSQTVRAPGY